MPAQSSEAIVLRTFPFKEADLIVSYFTRDLGKLRGVAKRARRPKSPFGAGLQRLSYVRMNYQHRDNRDLGPRVRPRLSHMKPRSSAFLLNRQRT